MKTVFVNPSRRSKRRAKKSRKHNIALANPRRKHRAKRRNAGISSFIQRNPLILENPRRRRRHGKRRNPIVRHKRRSRRSNPGINFSLKGLTTAAIELGGGAAIGFIADRYVVSAIPVTTQSATTAVILRTAIRLGVGVLAMKFLKKGDMGAAAAGAVLYPAMQDLAAQFMPGTVSPVQGFSADLAADLSADLSDMEEILDDMQVDGF